MRIAVLATDFTDDLSLSLERLKCLTRLNEYEVHFLHVTSLKDLDENKHTETVEDRKNVVRNGITKRLESIKAKYLPSLPEGQVQYKCIFSNSPEGSICDYATRTGADIVLLPSRFDQNGHVLPSQVPHYLLSHCPASLMVLK